MYGKLAAPTDCSGSGPWWCGSFLLAAAAGMLLVAAGPVWAQLTLDQLIGRAVEKPRDAQYRPVGQAIEAFFGGRIQQARQLLSAATAQHPELPPAGVLLAQMYFAANRVAEGRAELEQVVASVPEDPEPWLLLGDLALRDGRWTDADALYRRGDALCQQLRGNDFRRRRLQAGAMAGMTAVAAARGQWHSAQQYAQRWASLEPQSAQCHVQLGRAFFFQQQYQRALQELTAAHQLDSTLPRAEINMALLYEQLVAQGDKSKRASARRAIETAVANAPRDLPTRLAAARWALEACELEVAEANVKAALQLDEHSADAQLLAGIVARHRRDAVAAERALRNAHLLAPTSADALVQLVLALVEQQNEQKTRLALDFAELNFRAHADQTQQAGREAAIVLAWVLFQLGRGADALATVQAALRAGPVAPEPTYLAARMLAEAGRDQQALQLLQPMLSGDPCFPTRTQAAELLAKLQQKASP